MFIGINAQLDEIQFTMLIVEFWIWDAGSKKGQMRRPLPPFPRHLGCEPSLEMANCVARIYCFCENNRGSQMHLRQVIYFPGTSPGSDVEYGSEPLPPVFVLCVVGIVRFVVLWLGRG